MTFTWQETIAHNPSLYVAQPKVSSPEFGSASLIRPSLVGAIEFRVASSVRGRRPSQASISSMTLGSIVGSDTDASGSDGRRHSRGSMSFKSRSSRSSSVAFRGTSSVPQLSTPISMLPNDSSEALLGDAHHGNAVRPDVFNGLSIGTVGRVDAGGNSRANSSFPANNQDLPAIVLTNYEDGGHLLPAAGERDALLPGKALYGSLMPVQPESAPTLDVSTGSAFNFGCFRSRLVRFMPSTSMLLRTLFPTLVNWRYKNIFERILALCLAPSMLFLSITLPVQDETGGSANSEPYADCFEDDEHHEPLAENESIRTSNGIAAVHESAADSSLLEPFPDLLQVTNPTGRPVDQIAVQNASNILDRASLDQAEQEIQWLQVLHIFSAPWFLTLVLCWNLEKFRSTRSFYISIAISTAISTSFVTLLVLFPRSRQALLRRFLLSVGFLVSVCWIATIATEVVCILKAFGMVFSISEDVLGLTVFAIGNSLGDLVANTTIAKLGYPVMALSACYAAPLLNISTGIGFGGLYMTMRGDKQLRYPLQLDQTTFGSGLLLIMVLGFLLVAVPLNRWSIDRKLGSGLVLLWLVGTSINLVTRIKGWHFGI